MSTWNIDFRAFNDINHFSQQFDINHFPQQLNINFIEHNLQFLNYIPSTQIILNDYINQFKPEHIINDCCKLSEYEQRLLLMLKKFNLYIKQYNKLKNQYIIINYLLNNLNKNEIINILSDYEQFITMAEYFEFKTLPIQYIPYIIPHLNKFINDCPFDKLDNHCFVLINICDNIYYHEKFELFDLIFTDHFNQSFMKNIINHIQNFTINECNLFLINSNIGELIMSRSDLNDKYNEYINSKSLLEKL